MMFAKVYKLSDLGNKVKSLDVVQIDEKGNPVEESVEQTDTVSKMIIKDQGSQKRVVLQPTQKKEVSASNTLETMLLKTADRLAVIQPYLSKEQKDGARRLLEKVSQSTPMIKESKVGNAVAVPTRPAFLDLFKYFKKLEAQKVVEESKDIGQESLFKEIDYQVVSGDKSEQPQKTPLILLKGKGGEALSIRVYGGQGKVLRKFSFLYLLRAPQINPQAIRIQTVSKVTKIDQKFFVVVQARVQQKLLKPMLVCLDLTGKAQDMKSNFDAGQQLKIQRPQNHGGNVRYTRTQQKQMVRVLVNGVDQNGVNVFVRPNVFNNEEVKFNVQCVFVATQFQKLLDLTFE